MKISPSSRRFGYVQCQESYLLGLILGFIYKLPRKVYFDSCTFSLLASPLKKKLRLSQCFSFFCCSCRAFTCFLVYYVNLTKPGVIFSTVCWSSHKSLTYLSSWLLTAVDPHYLLPVIEAAAKIHLMSTHCERSWELRFIIAAKTYDPINIPSTFGNDNSVQRGKHLSSQTWCDEIFQMAVGNITTQRSLFATICTTNNASKTWTNGDFVWYNSVILKVSDKQNNIRRMQIIYSTSHHTLQTR